MTTLLSVTALMSKFDFDKVILFFEKLFLALAAITATFFAMMVETPTLLGLGILTTFWFMASIIFFISFACSIKEEGLDFAGIKRAAVKTYRDTGAWGLLTVFLSAGFVPAIVTYTLRLAIG